MHLDETVRTFLEERWIARVTTIGPDGYPHTVPVWYMLDGDDIVIATVRGARKIRNVEQNPKGAVSIGGDVKGAHDAYHRAYLFQGDFEVVHDPDGYTWLRRIARRYRDDHAQIEQDMREWGPHDVLRLRVRRVIVAMP